MPPDLMSQTYINELNLIRPEENYKAVLCFCYFPAPGYYHEAVKLLHPRERAYYDTLNFEKRKKTFLLGRYSVKQAVGALVGEGNLQMILVRQGVFNQPVTLNVRDQLVNVSITHCDDIGAAVAFPEAHPMGIDVEKVDAKKNDVFETQITNREKELIRTIQHSYDSMLTLLWTAKESLSKVLKTGMTTPFNIYEVCKIEERDNCLISHFKNFAQYKTVSINVNQYVCSLTYPQKTDLNTDIGLIKENIGSLVANQ